MDNMTTQVNGMGKITVIANPELSCQNIYDNTPIQYTANFDSCKNDNFQLKSFISYFCSN